LAEQERLALKSKKSAMIDRRRGPVTSEGPKTANGDSGDRLRKAWAQGKKGPRNSFKTGRMIGKALKFKKPEEWQRVGEANLKRLARDASASCL